MRTSVAFLFAFCILSILVTGIHSHAQGILVSPARLEARIPDDGLLPPVFVTNGLDVPVELHTDTGWVTHDIYGYPIYLPVDTKPSIAVRVAPSHLVLQPGEEVSLQVSVDPTDRAAYPVLYISFSPPGMRSGDIMRIAVPVLLHTGREEPRLRIEDVTLEQRSSGNHSLAAVVANDGQAHVRTQGWMQVFDSRGAVTVDMPLPETLVLPGARRLISMELDADALEWGEYSLALDIVGNTDADATPLRFAVGPNGVVPLQAEGLTQLARGEPIP